MKRVIIFFGLLIFFYLIGAFINVSFDISKWAIEFRGVISFLGVTMSFLFCTYPGIDD